MKQFENYAAALGDRYLRDAVHLRAGEMWSEQLQELIREAQVFQLFWSSNSMRSQFVRHEWEYALSLWRPNFVRPTYWEEPLPETPDKSLPSKELRRLHFQRISFPGPGSWRPADADERKKKLRPMHGARALCILAAAAFALGEPGTGCGQSWTGCCCDETSGPNYRKNLRTESGKPGKPAMKGLD